MANIVKKKVDGRTWNWYLEKFEDECSDEEVRIANEIIDIDEAIIAAYDLSDDDERDELVNDLRCRKMTLEAMIDA